MIIEELMGGTLTLPCNVTPPEGDTFALILWYKDNMSDAIFTYDARSSMIGDTSTLQKAMEGRATFHLGNPSYLSLKNASLRDSGKYECRVDFLKAPSRTTYLKLIVVDPPKGLLIKKIEGGLVSFTVSANLGDPLRLSCVANGGHPRPTVTWLINHDIADVTWDAFNGAMTQNDLILLSLTRDLHQAKLTCQASNNNITKPLTKEVILLLNLPPKKVKISGIPDVLHSGRKYSAKCDVLGARPDPIISWTIQPVGGKPQQVQGIVDLKNMNSKLMKIKKKIETSEFQIFPTIRKISNEQNLINSELRKTLTKSYTHEINKRGIMKRKKRRKTENKFSSRTYKKYFLKHIHTKIYNWSLPFFTYVNSNNNNTDANKRWPKIIKDIYLLYQQNSTLDPSLSYDISRPTNNRRTDVTGDSNASNILSTTFSLSLSEPTGNYDCATRTKRDLLNDTANSTIINTISLSDKANNTVRSATKHMSHDWIEVMVDSWLNGAKLTCTAISSALPDRPVSSIKELNVYYAPRLEISLGSPLKQDDIREGMDVYFHCAVDANPEVPHITWLINDKVIRHSPREGVLISAEHLVLQKVRRQWSGRFTCRGANGVSAASSPPFDLKVMFIPVCVNSVSLLWAGIGEEVVVPCRVVAHPPNITFYWTLTNSVTQERVSPERVIALGLESQLRYRPEKPHDYGRLQCWAENMLGQQKKPCVVTVKTAGSPAPPLNCSVHNQTWMGFDISCGKPQHQKTSEDATVTVVGPKKHTEEDADVGGIQEESVMKGGGVAKLMVGRDRIRYLLTVKESDGDTLVYNVSGESGLFRITGLTPGLDYVISISRFNNHGKSREVILEALTLRAAENRMREKDKTSGRGSRLAGLVAGGILVLLVLASSILLACLRGRRRRLETASDRIHLPSSASPTGTDDVLKSDKESPPEQTKIDKVNTSRCSDSDEEAESDQPTTLQLRRATSTTHCSAEGVRNGGKASLAFDDGETKDFPSSLSPYSSFQSTSIAQYDESESPSSVRKLQLIRRTTSIETGENESFL